MMGKVRSNKMICATNFDTSGTRFDAGQSTLPTLYCVKLNVRIENEAHSKDAHPILIRSMPDK